VPLGIALRAAAAGAQASPSPCYVLLLKLPSNMCLGCRAHSAVNTVGWSWEMVRLLPHWIENVVVFCAELGLCRCCGGSVFGARCSLVVRRWWTSMERLPDARLAGIRILLSET
ncbi:hypothetical protein FN846DRAFT_954562, partial [Sphaerosporella brunnea]